MDFKIFPVLLIALVVLVSGCIQETEIDKDKLKDLLGETIDDVSFDQTALKDKEDDIRACEAKCPSRKCSVKVVTSGFFEKTKSLKIECVPSSNRQDSWAFLPNYSYTPEPPKSPAPIQQPNDTTASASPIVSPPPKETFKVASFQPQGDFGASFTLEGDELEYNTLFVRKYGSPDVAGSWGILAYLLIPQGYLGDVGNEFILTTNQGVTYRFRSRGFTTKSVTLEDQYGTQYKVDLNKGETTNCIAPYSGTLQLISKYPVEYIDYNCISDTGLTTIDQLKIGEPRNTGPIKYYLKNNLQIELKDKLKEGPLTTRPVPVFYIKSGDKILYEVIFRFVDYEMGIVDVFDSDLNDQFVDKESEFVVGAWEIHSQA